MKELSLDDRPREKLLQHGPSALGDNELVALVLGSGHKQADALGVANAVLTARGGLHGLARSSWADLTRIGGVGRAKAAQLVAALELGRRTLTHGPSARLRLRNAQDAADYLLPMFGARPVEQFGIVLLDSKGRVLRTVVIASGSLNATVVEPREVYREAIVGMAAAIVAFHNHPSGDPMPSRDDVELTNRLREAGVLVGIDLLDHLVLGDAKWCSMKTVLERM
jgi:DNA repair protein RadC